MLTVFEKPISFNGGIYLSPNKSMSLAQPIKKANLPSLIKIPVRQHIGLPAKIVVKCGDKVLKGQMIANPHGYISAPVHASTSGTVIEIAEHFFPNPSGEKLLCIVIKTDGDNKSIERKPFFEHYSELSPVKIQQLIFEAGIVGLGGAGFPSAVKLIPGLNLDIELLILNAVECEPYISCDEALIQNHVHDVIKGLKILAYALQVDNCVIAIEDNKIEAINTLQDALQTCSDPEVKLIKVPSRYPAGGEKQIIKSITGLDVPVAGLPLDLGIICYNVGTAVAVKKAIIDTEPLISRIITITGPGITHPCNLEVLIGTPINELVKQCGGYNKQFNYLIVGGPMMGFKLHNEQAPVIKTTNCLLAADTDIGISETRESPCIGCDECARVCPVSLQPQQLYRNARELNIHRLEDGHLFDCIECGCCSYICPSYIPLVKYYRDAKHQIWDRRHKQREAKQNRQRYVDKQVRLKEQRQFNQVLSSEIVSSKEDEIMAAVSRVRAKRKLKKTNSNS